MWCLSFCPCHICNCVYNYISSLCLICMQTFANLCSQVHCQNGGSCSQTTTSWTCHCKDGWKGLYCDVPGLSCQDYAATKGEEAFIVYLFGEKKKKEVRHEITCGEVVNSCKIRWRDGFLCVF